jgi:RHS repeat-associated protein/uncharacterized repeat protein (TIGR01451 family)
LLPQRVRADTSTSKLTVRGSITSISVNPNLTLTLAVDKATAIPGDALKYSGTVTHTGITACVNGSVSAQNTGGATATVADFFDEIDYWDPNALKWVPLAGTVSTRAAFIPVITPRISTGITITVTSVAASGVTYPSTGDPIIGTTIAAGATAAWNGSVCITLTAAQLNALFNAPKLRVESHFEDTPGDPSGEAWTNDQECFNPLQAGFLNARNVAVTVTPPSGPQVQITSSTVPAFSSLAPGASASYATTYLVPTATSRGSSETEAAYLQRLTNLEGSSLKASASLTATGPTGNVSSSAPPVTSTEHVPIVTINKSGPATVTAGTTATYPLALKNAGGAPASGIAVADTMPGGATGTVTGAPTTLAVGASSTNVQATFAVPPSQSQGNLTDTATVNWLDANSNAYGSVSSSFTTLVQNPLLGAKLVLSLSAGSAGLNPINGTQVVQISLLNSAGAPIPNQSVTVNVTGANPTSLTAVTDTNGQATVSLAGKNSGVDQLQATASSAAITIQSNTVSVTWIQPIQPISTTPVQGNFYAESANAQTFVAKPGDPAAFQQTFPTINFNPPANTIPHNVSGIGPTTTPFTDVTTDAVGNFVGTIAAQGNGLQAGLGTLSNFDAVLTANFVVSQPQDVTFKVIADDGFVLGVGGGATRVSGALTNPPASGFTAFNGYLVVGAYNTGGATSPGTYDVTIHFPSAGAFPYELDYFECCGTQLSLTMTIVSVNTGPYNLSTGYADTIRPAGSSSFPFPWNGAANTTFVGSGSPYDTGGLRFDNNTNQPITLNHVTVDIGSRHYDPWNLNLNVPPNGTLILAGAGAFNTSEANGALKSGGGGSSGFTASQWATGFAPGGGGVGPVGVAFDNAGNLFVMDYAFGFLYKFPPGGGVAGPATRVNANSIQGCPAGLAFSKDGKHLYLAMQCLGTVLEVDQASGVVLRTVASGISAPTGIATDPLSGDLFVSQPNGTPTILRIQNPTTANPPVSVYSSPGSTDGIAFGPDGTLYGATSGPQVVIIAGTNTASPGTVLTRIQNSTALSGIDGIALLPPPPGAVGTSIAVNSNFGFIVQIDNPQTPNPTFHNIFTGGSRGDFATVGGDGCLYATQTSSIIKVTASDGSCPFIPSICLPNPVIPQVHVTINGFTFNYNDSGQALNSGGIDGECNGTNESQAWQQIGGKGGPVNIPLPPAMTLGLQAAPSNGHIVGQPQAFTVAAMDGAGHTVPNVAVQLGVFGANPRQLAGTTDVTGTATFSYNGSNVGTDTVTATAFISGLRTVSNAVPIQWTIPAPGGPIPGASGPAPPSVVVTSPTDGSAVSQPVSITATIRAPPSSPINFWSAQYQNVSGGSPVTLASGTTNPPATLATFDPTALGAGTYAISVTATTSAGGGATAVARVIVGNGGGTTAQAPPTISAPSPADGSIVTKPVPVTATIAPPSGQTIATWNVTYQAQDVEPIVSLASGTGTPPATLTTFDPTLLPNDTYVITVTATASGGGTQTTTTTVAVFGNLKLGRYVTTFQDLIVPVNGFQMEVRRTYDSIDKRVGDFGIGWHVDLANFRVSVNHQLGAGGWTEYPTSCIFGLCFYGFKTSAPHYVTVTFPDQHQEIFDFTPQGGAGILYWQGNAAFTARAATGTTSTLEVAGDSSLSYDFAGNLVAGSGYFNPTRFKLTTRDGRVLILDTVLGLVSETDRNGNTLNIDANGVHASNGQSITYTRDGNGRITKITGPSGQVLAYAYSAAGDLASTTDANNNGATFTYDSNHNLLTFSGPTQARPLNTLSYDTGGRLVSVTDGNGNTTQISSNASGQQQTVTDATGRLTTVATLDDLGDVLRLDQVFGAATLTTRWTYDAVGHPLSRIDALGNTWKAAYDGNGGLTTFSDPMQNGIGLAYDSFAAPVSFTDPLGKVSQYGYDSAGNLISFTNALGQVERYNYNSQGHQISRTDPAGQVWTYQYDLAGHRTSAIDPLGRATVYGYDANGRMTSITDPAGGTTRFTFDAAGNLITLTDAQGNQTTSAYDGLNRLVRRRDALGGVTTYAYDGNDRLMSSTDALGRTTGYAYDADGRQITETDPAGDLTQYSYDGLGRLIGETDPVGRLTSHAYDVNGHLVKTTLPNGASVAYRYDSAGRQVGVVDPLGGVTTSVFDAGGRRTGVTDPLGNRTGYTYDALGRETQVLDALGQTQTRTYDPVGNLVAVTDALGKKTTYGYDAAGERTAWTDPLGHATGAAFDAAGRLVKVTDPLGRSTSFGYDLLGRLTATTLPSGIKTAYTYDALGREITVVDALGNMGTYSYDAAGQRSKATDPRGNPTAYGYDAAGRLVSITDALGGKVAISYDAAGQKTAIVAPRGDTTSTTYDPLGNLATETRPASPATSNTYDAAGRLTSKTDPRGITVSLAYDADNRLTSTSFPGGTVTQVYDALGRRTSMTDPTGTTSFSYDAASRATAVAAPQGTVNYSYDAAGRRTALTLPGSRTITYAYDAGDQLTSLTDWFNQSTTFSYNADGLRTLVSRPGNLQTTLAYDGADRLTSVNSDGPPGGANRHFSYTLDADGNRTAVTSSSGTESYTLDALNRITQASYPNGDKLSFTYDSAGNRTSQIVNGVTTNSGYDTAGRLVQAGATAYTYDAAGNLTGAGLDSFSWDWAGRLTKAMVGGSTATNTYDGDGLRVTSQIGSSLTSYLWDRQSPLPVLVDDGTHGYVQTDAGLLEQLDAGGSSTATFPLLDALGSVRGVGNASGGQVGSADYDVFGAVRATTGTSSIFGFTGQQTDPGGLLYMRARHLNTGLGRFLSADTIFPNAQGTQGYNRYAYATNNPTTFIDPGGHEIATYSLTTGSVGARTIPAASLVGAEIYFTFFLLTVALTAPLITALVPPLTWNPSPAKTDDSAAADSSTAAATLSATLAAALTAAKAAVRTCIQNGVPSKSPCDKLRINVYLPGLDAPETTGHIVGALVGNPNWAELAYGTNSSPAGWYAGDPRCAGNNLQNYCDEYPFYSTKQGGRGASLKVVPSWEQVIQRTSLSSFYRSPRCGIVKDDPQHGQFLVIPGLSPITTYYCKSLN